MLDLFVEKETPISRIQPDDAQYIIQESILNNKTITGYMVRSNRNSYRMGLDRD